jgi:pantothenate kinase
MDQRVEDQVSPHRPFTRAAWTGLRADTSMARTSNEVAYLQPVNDRLDGAEVESCRRCLASHYVQQQTVVCPNCLRLRSSELMLSINMQGLKQLPGKVIR